MMDDSLCLGAIILERDNIYFTLFRNFRNYLHPSSSHFTRKYFKQLHQSFGNCTASDHNTLQWIVKAVEKVIGVPPLSLWGIYHQHCIRRACSILKEKKTLTHTAHTFCCIAVRQVILQRSLVYFQTVQQFHIANCQTSQHTHFLTTALTHFTFSFASVHSLHLSFTVSCTWT